MTSLWFNEIDYDEPGTDANSFIEIAFATTVNLADYAVVLVNGSGNTPYATFNLSTAGAVAAAGQKLVIGNTTVAGSIPSGTLFLDAGTGDFIQNGSPDGFALVNLTTGEVVEFWSYEGTMTGVSFATLGVAGLHDAIPISPLDDPAFAMSLVRASATTWMSSPSLTPGGNDPVVNFTPASLSVAGNTSAVESTDANGALYFTVKRSDSAGTASVDWSLDFSGTATAGDVVNSSGTVNFKDGQALARIKITLQADAVAEANENFTFAFQTPSTP